MYRTPEELMTTKEDLHEDLEDCICKDSGWVSLKHPLIYAVPYTEMMNAYYNESYKCKLDRLQEVKKLKDWSSYIFLYERPYRIQAFYDIHDKLADQEYWELLGSILIDTENQWQYKSILGTLINSNRPGREYLMGDEDKELLANLPEEFLVYRGHQRHNKLGYSWTLSSWQARWFASRFQINKEGIVTVATVKKQDVYAVLLGRREMEVVINPYKLTDFLTLTKLRRPALVQNILQKAVKEFTLGKKSHHGPWHWDKVERNAIALAKKTPGADLLVCRLFSVLHDCKRKNENDDPEHGHRAADFILENALPLKHWQLDKLVEACKYHNDGQLSNDPTIGVCWDADRLDLPRVDMVPNPKLLSTEAAKSLIWRI